MDFNSTVKGSMLENGPAVVYTAGEEERGNCYDGI